MADPAREVDFDAEAAAGRRRRGLIIAAVIAVVGIPMALVDWWSEREVERQAQEVAASLREAAEEVDDPVGLAGDEVVAGWVGEAGALDAVLGHGGRRRGLAAVPDGVALAYEVTYWLETRCVHLRLTRDDVRVEVEDTARCGPRAEP